MKKIMCQVFFICALFSCDDNDINKDIKLILGTYKGHFIRSSPTAKYAPSNITLTFTSVGFSGESDVAKYPAICNGTYIITGQEIDFSNDCPWTAEFDWSLILNGKFEINVDNDQLEMKRYLNGGMDYYNLQLQ